MFVLVLSILFSLSHEYLYDVNICVSLSVVVLVTTNEAKVDMRQFLLYYGDYAGISTCT